MSIHINPQPESPKSVLPPWLQLGIKFYNMVTVIEVMIRSERRQRERQIAELRSEIAALRKQMEAQP